MLASGETQAGPSSRVKLWAKASGSYSLGAHGAGLVPHARGPATYRPGAARGCRSPDESLCHSSHHHRPPGLRVPTGGGTHAAAVHPALVCAHLYGACRMVGWAVGWVGQAQPIPHLWPPSPAHP